MALVFHLARGIMAAAILLLAACGPGGQAPTDDADLAPAPEQLDVPYVPTPMVVVEEMLRLGRLPTDGRLIDLGSGDGRIVITAALTAPGVTGLGVDIDPTRIREARAAAREAGVSDRVEFRQQDLFETPLADADVLTMYLLPSVNLQLRERIFAELRPGARVVSHDFDMGDWLADETATAPGDGSTIYLWIVPAAFGGVWEIEGVGPRPVRVALTQRFQMLEGGADGFTATGKVRGAEATITLSRAGAASIEVPLRLDGGGEGPIRARRLEAAPIQLSDPAAAAAPFAPADLVQPE